MADKKIIVMHKLKPYKQTYSYCGPACIKMVLSYNGIEFSETKIAKLVKATRELGTPIKNFVIFFKKYGFKNARLKYNSTLNDLEAEIKKGPVILSWFYDFNSHYSVAIGYTDKSLILAEPLDGKIKYISKKDFLSSWFDYTGDYPKTSKDIRIRAMIITGKKFG
ncbi:MAG: cysteine peptidase family C39 domain-containing protein [Nanoarchaeota archaeon]|nr:cysteine peptidase family C39 domain-containing protein [Nanoarchaeota archaeon]